MVTKDANEKNKPSTRHFIHGYHLIQGQMNQHRNLDGYDLGLYAIFEGHSGHEVAKYLQSHLFENILSEVYPLVTVLFQSTLLLFSLIFDILIMHG